MKALFLSSALLLIAFSALQAQDDPKQVRWMFETNMGAGFQLSNFKSTAITNSFVSYNSPTFQWDHSATRFFNPHTGIEVEFSLGGPGADTYRAFNDKLNQRFGSQYYISDSGIFPYGSPILRLSVGFVYKMEKGRFLFMARPLIGFTSFETYSYTAGLKEKNSNNRSTVTWHPTTGSEFIPTFRPAVTVGYRMTKRFYLTFNVKYSVYKSNFDYIETTKDNVTEQSSVVTYPYRATIQDISLTLGAIFTLNKRKSQ